MPRMVRNITGSSWATSSKLFAVHEMRRGLDNGFRREPMSFAILQPGEISGKMKRPDLAATIPQ